MTDAQVARVDAFVDAAFAFAVTLLVVFVGGGQTGSDVLEQTVAAIPSFAIGFAILAMFWVAHLGWRRLRGPGDWRSLLLTLLLVFVTLIFVGALREMAASLAAYIRGTITAGARDVAQLFTIYGIAFATMAAITALLYRDALRNSALARGEARAALGQVWIWTILAVTGAVSAAVAAGDGTWFAAPWLYATLPLSIGIFVRLWDWEGSVADRGGTSRDPAREAVLAPDDVQP